jgi:hypothetical protein
LEKAKLWIQYKEWLPRVGGEGIAEAQKIIREGKQSRTVLSWSIREITQLPEPTGCIAPSEPLIYAMDFG